MKNTPNPASTVNDDEYYELLKSRAPSRIMIPPVQMDGFAAASGRNGETIPVQQRGFITSLQYDFYTRAASILNVTGSKRCWNLLIRTNAKETKVFEDNFPVTIEIRAKKRIEASRAVFTKDIADIIGLSFSDIFADVNPEAGEKVCCILSDGYMHGLGFDFTGNLDPIEFKKGMGMLYREIKYAHVYRALDMGLITSMIKVGWFPFVEMMGHDCDGLLRLVEEGRADSVGLWIDEAFPNERVQEFTLAWEEHAVYSKKAKQFSEGLKNFYDGSFAAAVLTLTPLFEGILNDYVLAKTGKGITFRGDDIAAEAHKIAQAMADDRSMLLPNEFREYLVDHYFKHTRTPTSSEAVRNPASHGRCDDDAFTRQSALQVILALDHLLFFIKGQPQSGIENGAR